MKSHFSQRLQGTMDRMKWPSKDLQFPDDVQLEWRENFGLLLDLQIPYAFIEFLLRKAVHALTQMV